MNGTKYLLIVLMRVGICLETKPHNGRLHINETCHLKFLLCKAMLLNLVLSIVKLA